MSDHELIMKVFEADLVHGDVHRRWLAAWFCRSEWIWQLLDEPGKEAVDAAFWAASSAEISEAWRKAVEDIHYVVAPQRNHAAWAAANTCAPDARAGAWAAVTRGLAACGEHAAECEAALANIVRNAPPFCHVADQIRLSSV